VSSRVKDVLGVQSPSTVFIGIGEDTAEGFSLGIINSLGFVEAAGTQMGDTFADATVAAVAQLNERIADLRIDLFGSLLGGGATRDSALRGVQGTLRSFTDALAGPIAEAAANGAEATRLIDFGAGLDNRNAIAEVVEGIKGFAKDFLQSGATVAETQAAVLQKRAEALDIAAFLGFDRTQIDDFFNGLGLSASGLETFASQLLTETERLKKEAEQEEAERRKSEADAGKSEADAAAEQTIEQTVNVNLALPFADPEAVALAVANRTASLVRRR
jgi:hypothetical protein